MATPTDQHQAATEQLPVELAAIDVEGPARHGLSTKVAAAGAIIGAVLIPAYTELADEAQALGVDPALYVKGGVVLAALLVVSKAAQAVVQIWRGGPVVITAPTPEPLPDDVADAPDHPRVA